MHTHCVKTLRHAPHWLGIGQAGCFARTRTQGTSPAHPLPAAGAMMMQTPDALPLACPSAPLPVHWMWRGRCGQCRSCLCRQPVARQPVGCRLRPAVGGQEQLYQRCQPVAVSHAIRLKWPLQLHAVNVTWKLADTLCCTRGASGGAQAGPGAARQAPWGRVGGQAGRKAGRQAGWSSLIMYWLLIGCSNNLGSLLPCTLLLGFSCRQVPIVAFL